MQWSYEVDTNEVVPQYAMLDPPFRINRFALHRDSERQLHFDTKFEHEEMVLVA